MIRAARRPPLAPARKVEPMEGGVYTQTTGRRIPPSLRVLPPSVLPIPMSTPLLLLLLVVVLASESFASSEIDAASYLPQNAAEA